MDVPHCRILSPDTTEWRRISATLCGWRRCFVADQLWYMTRIREEDCCPAPLEGQLCVKCGRRSVRRPSRRHISTTVSRRLISLVLHINRKLYSENPPYFHLATSEMWCWFGGRGTYKKLSLSCSIVYYYNGAQMYEQFIQVGRLHRALILLGLVALNFPSVSVSSVFMVLYIIFLITFFCLPFSELSLVGLILYLVD